ncbi:MAG: tRNA (adenosine(37)-N6)-threonylcarbamoyltransferase complex dimerization subunit type 1 TsaB [Clostridiales bacterium]|nr:tRNA (adenosine(37)-N6)-threonylcarbamoyltransferase complex dimerization subunit type 1 TsaB [Candidatus Crickella merdequi]
MLILALETTGKYGSAALIDEAGNITASSSSCEMNHLKEIITLAEECLTRAGRTVSDITHVATSEGPGSFTGIRIGVTTARTLAQMLEIPCTGVSSLAGMALNGAGAAEEMSCTYICPIINARRRQTYGGFWKVQNGVIEAFKEQKQYMIEEICEIASTLDGRVFFTGDGIDAYEAIIRESLDEEKFVLADTAIRYQTAETVAAIAAEKVKAGDVVSFEELLPNYMRLSEAEQRLKEGTLSRKIAR